MIKVCEQYKPQESVEIERKTGLKLGRYYLGVNDNNERLLFQIISINFDRFEKESFCVIAAVNDICEFNKHYYVSTFDFKYKYIRFELPEDITEEEAIIFYKSTIDNDDLYERKYRELIW